MLFKMNTTEAINLRKEIMALTNDIKAEIIRKKGVRGIEGLEGKELQDFMEQVFEEKYLMTKDFEFLTRRKGMEFLFKEDEGDKTTLYYQVTPEALSSLNVIFNESNRDFYYNEKKYIPHEGYLPNGVGPINGLFMLTIVRQNYYYKALTTNFSYPEFLRPYKVLLEKRVRLGELLTAVGGQSYLMDKLLGKNKLRKSRSRKVRKMRHSLYRKSH